LIRWPLTQGQTQLGIVIVDNPPLLMALIVQLISFIKGYSPRLFEKIMPVSWTSFPTPPVIQLTVQLVKVVTPDAIPSRST